jgi:hypothetical protein
MQVEGEELVGAKQNRVGNVTKLVKSSIIGPQRLGWARNGPSPFAAAEIIGEKAEKIGVSVAYLDGLLWLFGAKGYGDICAAMPNCGACQVSWCNQRVQN